MLSTGAAILVDCMVPVSNVIFSSKTDIFSKIAILNFTCGVVLGSTLELILKKQTNQKH